MRPSLEAGASQVATAIHAERFVHCSCQQNAQPGEHSLLHRLSQVFDHPWQNCDVPCLVYLPPCCRIDRLLALVARQGCSEVWRKDRTATDGRTKATVGTVATAVADGFVVGVAADGRSSLARLHPSAASITANKFVD